MFNKTSIKLWKTKKRFYAQKLTELRLKQKMLKWAFENSKRLPEERMNAILDEKLRIDHLIEMLETKLKELEK